MARPHCLFLPAVAALLLGSTSTALLAQKIGEPAPDLVYQHSIGFGDLPNQRLSELRGSVLVLFFWSSFAMPCAAQVAPLNERFAEFGPKGLVVLGVTTDDAAAAQAWVQKHNARFPNAVATSQDYRVGELPEALVIDKDFRLRWRGHPAALAAANLETLLVGAKPAIVLPGLEPVQELRRSGDFGQAYRKGQELLQAASLTAPARNQLAGWLRQIEQAAAAATAAAAQANAANDVYAEWLELDRLANGYLGAPGTEGVATRLQELLAEPKHKREIEAGRRLAAAQAQEAALAYDAAHAAYKAVVNSFSNTKAGKAAAAALKELESAGKLGFQAACPYCKAAGVACPQHRKKKPR